MAEHVHVRVRRGVAVTDDGALVERYACRCGESWTKTYQVEGPAPE
ncbi:hypothetical protein QCN29_03700 [Streptomyces sp. HNM0663]|uniref:Uncharacterized protein n=1 Tax=Streptomyces chengmaiensis TaxID=3040919 RepID=A0ABT6HH45_9ACTN|nr:hypothetical protein [Streptomyces chengmaiensis]MDH2387906.1 hypothetical protein [Streptomyces chengmaiensis]